jgi:putative Mg2+ transporter-C (MgtC) family protein
MDVARLGAQVISGIGFLGAGTIFIQDKSVKGLTTSAGIWATAGIGLALGSGMYVVGIAATVILILAQLLLHRFGGGLDNVTLSEVTVTAIYTPDVIENLKNMFKAQGIEVQNCHASKGKDNTIELRMTVKSAKEIEFDSMVNIFEHNENIISFSL